MRPVLLSAVALATCSLASSQRLVGYDATGLVHEFPSPVGGACVGPTDPVFTFPLGGTFGPCALPGGAIGPIDGDIGVDTLSDTYWVTDGFALGEYTSAGVPIAAYNGAFGALAFPITGLGVDTGNALLWATDGVLCQSFLKPPSGAGCFAGLTPAGPPFLCSLTGVAVTDVEWDPVLGELWLAEGIQVSSFFPTGVLGTYVLWNVAGCAPPIGGLQGLGVDTAGVVTGSPLPLLYSTDRASILYDAVACCAAPPTAKVYPTATCFGTPGPLHGLSYTARPNHYGTSSWCVPGSTPTLDTLGQSVIGNATFGFQISSALPGKFPFLYYATNPLCPPFGIVTQNGCLLTVWINPINLPPPIVMPVTNANGQSTVVVPMIAPYLGQCRYFQAILLGIGGLESTDALEVIATLP